MRLEAQQEMLQGDGSGERWMSIQGQLDATENTGQVKTYNAANATDALSALHEAILHVRGAGGLANVFFARAPELQKIYELEENKRSPFADTMRLPYGSPMGCAAILSPDMPANTILVASMGQFMYHVIPVMGGFTVESDNSVRFDYNEITLRGNFFAQNVVQNQKAFRLLVGANHLTGKPDA